jgi:hypothetical protein
VSNRSLPARSANKSKAPALVEINAIMWWSHPGVADGDISKLCAGIEAGEASCWCVQAVHDIDDFH